MKFNRLTSFYKNLAILNPYMESKETWGNEQLLEKLEKFIEEWEITGVHNFFVGRWIPNPHFFFRLLKDGSRVKFSNKIDGFEVMDDESSLLFDKIEIFRSKTGDVIFCCTSKIEDKNRIIEIFRNLKKKNGCIDVWNTAEAFSKDNIGMYFLDEDAFTNFGTSFVILPVRIGKIIGKETLAMTGRNTDLSSLDELDTEKLKAAIDAIIKCCEDVEEAIPEVKAKQLYF